MKIINSKIHGLIDYAFIGLLWLAPMIFGLEEKAFMFSNILGSIHLILTIFTNFEFGLFRFIPFKIHGLVGLIVPFLLIGVAIYLAYVENDFSRNYFFGVAVAVFATWIFTDYKSFNDNKNY